MFDLLVPPYLSDSVGKPVVAYFKRRFGAASIKIEKSFSQDVNWVPTIQVAAPELTLVEIAESPYPTILKAAYADLLHAEANRLIRVYQACPLEIYQQPRHSKEFRDLRAHGFGLITVDDQGTVDEQFGAAVLIHHIAEPKFDQMVKSLPSDVRVALSRAFAIYRTDGLQGLQAAAQVVEGLIHAIAEGSAQLGHLASYSPRTRAADLLDNLYAASALAAQRACFGGARQFMKTYRNPSSHPAKSKQQATARKLNVREGFEAAIGVAGQLAGARKELGIRKKLAA